MTDIEQCIMHVSKYFASRNRDAHYEELYNEALLAVLEQQPATVQQAGGIARTAIIRFLRWLRNPVSMPWTSGHPEIFRQQEYEPIETVPVAYDGQQALILALDMNAKFAQIPEKARGMWRMRIYGYTDDEIAAQFATTKSRAVVYMSKHRLFDRGKKGHSQGYRNGRKAPPGSTLAFWEKRWEKKGAAND